MDAWAKVKWCWTNGRVVSAYGAGKGELAINHWDLPVSYKFLRWEEQAYWEGTNYIIERSAVFWGQAVFCGIGDDGSAPPICPGEGYRLELTFVLEPGGKYRTGFTLST